MPEKFTRVDMSMMLAMHGAMHGERSLGELIILGRLPDEARTACYEKWQPAYLSLDLWGSRDQAFVP